MSSDTLLHTILRPLALAVTLLLVPGAFATEITVNTADDENNTDGDCSLREAVQAANTDTAVDGCAAGEADGDTIVFDNDYTITLTLGELLLSDDVRIEGLDSADRVVIDGAGR